MKIQAKIKDPDTLRTAVEAAGLSPSAYLEYGEYADIEFKINADASITGRIVRRDGKRGIKKITAAERQGEE